MDKGVLFLRKKIPIFYSALLLTGVNLLLRLVSTSFQVYISAKIGPHGVGLLQLVLSVGSMAMVAGMAGCAGHHRLHGRHPHRCHVFNGGRIG